MHEMIFGTVAFSGRNELDALMFARSVRKFGGKYANNPIWIAVPNSVDSLNVQVREAFEKIDVRLIPFELTDEEMRFMYAPKTIGAGVVEALAVGETEILVWLDNTCFILNEPAPFILPENISFGWRPVDHRNIGSLYDEPLDDFWALIYQDCEVPDSRVFPMKPAADTQLLRSYINAGISIVRPERGILKAVGEKFRAVFNKPVYQAFYEEFKYQVFVHQAIYSGVILNLLKPSEMLELPMNVNYSLILHEEYLPEEKAAYMNDQISVRHEGYLEEPGWQGRIGIREPLLGWIKEQVDMVERFLNEEG